jgi:tetratricopeptide (TPR) repeat protein
MQLNAPITASLKKLLMMKLSLRLYSCAALLTSVTLLGAFAPAFGASQKDHDDCIKDSGDQAIAGCTSIINDGSESVPNRFAAYSNRGVKWVAKGDIDRAIADFSEAIRLEPKLGVAYRNRGGAWSAKGDYDRAIADFNEVIRLDSKDILAYISRGDAYLAKKDYGRAITDYTEAIRLDPKLAVAYNNRCWARAITGGALLQALGDCDQAVRLESNEAGYLDTRGFVYLQLGRFDEAIADYNVALKIDPKLAGSLYGRGLAKLKKGDVTGGNADIATAKAIKSDVAEDFAR